MNILVTGKHSFIGKNIKAWLEQSGNFKVDELDLHDENWDQLDFSTYDSVIHVAAIFNNAPKNLTRETYYYVNSLLPKKVAQSAKNAGIKQFIFISSISVYGQEKKLPYGNIIDCNTLLEPTTSYGKSKYEAELLLRPLQDENFKICVVRAPNVYGKNCSGTYFSSFVKLAKSLPIFPKAFELSKQSILHVDNLAEFIRLLIIDHSDGVFMPQDGPPISTVEFMQLIAVALNKRIYFSKILGIMIRPLGYLNIVRKVFGGLSYDISLSQLEKGGNYALCSYQDSFRKSI